MWQELADMAVSTADDAKAKLREWAESSTGCCYECRMAHEKILIKPNEEWLDQKFREQLMRESTPKAKTPNTKRRTKATIIQIDRKARA